MERDARDAILRLLSTRANEATICPSQVARELAAKAGDGDWRIKMPAVHAAVDLLVAERLVQLSWKGKL